MACTTRPSTAPRVLLLAAILQLPLAACAQAPTVPQLTSEAARDAITQNAGRADFVVLDVRTPDEFRAGHIAGAVNVDFHAPDFERQLAKLDRSRTYLVYCRTGNRSSKSLPVLARLGFARVLHLEHGITEWKSKGLPVE